MSAYTLPSLQIDQIIRTKPVIIFPDSVAQIMPEDLAGWVKDYLRKGGNVAVVYDAGIRAAKGHFLRRAILSNITGINYIGARVGNFALYVRSHWLRMPLHLLVPHLVRKAWMEDVMPYFEARRGPGNAVSRDIHMP